MPISLEPLQTKRSPVSADGKLGAKRPFTSVDAAHAAVRIPEALNWNLADPQSFLRQAPHVEYRLSAEIEFAAILRWLGRCRFCPSVQRGGSERPGPRYDGGSLPACGVQR